MLVEYLKSKIHGVVITQTELEYQGSITIDSTLMKAANLRPNEKVAVFNFENGNRLETYVIEGEENSGVIGLNGPAALLGKPGQRLVIVSYALLDNREVESHKPAVVMVDRKNKIV